MKTQTQQVLTRKWTTVKLNLLTLVFTKMERNRYKMCASLRYLQFIHTPSYRSLQRIKDAFFWFTRVHRIPKSVFTVVHQGRNSQSRHHQDRMDNLISFTSVSLVHGVHLRNIITVRILSYVVRNNLHFPF